MTVKSTLYEVKINCIYKRTKKQPAHICADCFFVKCKWPSRWKHLLHSYKEWHHSLHNRTAQAIMLPHYLQHRYTCSSWSSDILLLFLLRFLKSNTHLKTTILLFPSFFLLCLKVRILKSWLFLCYDFKKNMFM